MLDFIGTIVLTTVIILNINAFTNGIAVSAAARLALVTGAGAWVGLAAAVAAAGVFSNAILPFPWIGAFVAIPLLLAGAAALLFPEVRAAFLRVPLSTLVGLNIARSLGIFFILLAWSGRLGGPFPQSAGWGMSSPGCWPCRSWDWRRGKMRHAIAQSGFGMRSAHSISWRPSSSA
jgi:hypothetical protein